MAKRTTHRPAPAALFLIGIRFNKVYRPDAWLPAFFAMPKMISELSKDAGSGFLGYRLLRGERGVTVIQYWRDVDSIYRYANDPDREHRPAWLHFYRVATRVPGAVGVWHETYDLQRAESLYLDMPPTGLAKALGEVPVTPGSETAKERIARRAASQAASHQHAVPPTSS